MLELSVCIEETQLLCFFCWSCLSVHWLNDLVAHLSILNNSHFNISLTPSRDFEIIWLPYRPDWDSVHSLRSSQHGSRWRPCKIWSDMQGRQLFVFPNRVTDWVPQILCCILLWSDLISSSLIRTRMLALEELNFIVCFLEQKQYCET